MLAVAGCISLALASFTVLSLAHIDTGPVAGLITALAAVVAPLVATLVRVEKVSNKVDGVANGLGTVSRAMGPNLDTAAAAAVVRLLDPSFFGDALPPGSPAPSSTPAGPSAPGPAGSPPGATPGAPDWGRNG